MGERGPPWARADTPHNKGIPAFGQEGASRSARTAAAEIGEVTDSRQLHGQPGGSKLLSPVGLLQFDKRSIMRGLIWHEILGEPPSIKRLRRTRSRLH